MDLILLLVLLAFSAFFSGSETALFSLDRERLAAYAASNRPLKRLVVRLLGEPRRLLITILLGNLSVNVFFYAVASRVALRMADEHGTLVGTAVGVAAPVVVIIFGEVTPKALALGFSDVVAPMSAPVLSVVRWIVAPLRIVVNQFARLVGNLSTRRMPPSTLFTPDELKTLIHASEQQGLIERRESLMMRELVDLGTMLVRDVMVPRVDMVMFQRGGPVVELVDIIRRTGHSAIPVYGQTQDDVVGIADAREVLLAPHAPVEDALVPAWFVPETKSVESLLGEFRREHRASAIVVDEYGGTAGLVTLEDAVEAFVGEIRDEYDTPESPVRDLGDNRYLLSGRLSIDDWTDLFGLSVDDRRSATLGGLVVSLLGHLPVEGERVRYGSILFTVTRMHRRRVREVLVEYAGEPGSEDSS